MAVTFEKLAILPELISRCHKYGWSTPLPIQISAIVPALHGKDIVGISETGSGKTAAFLLPIIQHWVLSGRPNGYALILAPTRELVCQIAETATSFMEDFQYPIDGKLSIVPFNVIRLIGGENSVDQALTLAWCRHHMIVATPGRLMEHMRQSVGFAQHHISTIKQLVIDEADRMLSMEFADDLDALLNVFERPKLLISSTRDPKKSQTYLERLQNTDKVTKKKVYRHKGDRFPHPQTYLFTATMSKDVAKLRRSALDRQAVLCTISSSAACENLMRPAERELTKVSLPAGLSHFVLPVRRVDKLAVLDWLIERAFSHLREENEKEFKIIIFCARCHETRYLAAFLRERGHLALGLTGRLPQSKRKCVLDEFSNGRTKVLVATDVASRGLDLPMVSMVINYGVPLTSKTYRHRVGRTARVGRVGTAVTIVTRDDGAAFLELEASLLPVKAGEERRSLPKWPHSLPPDQATTSIANVNSSGDNLLTMPTRRRLAEEAWSRAAKSLQVEEENRFRNRRSIESSSDDDRAEREDYSDYESTAEGALGDRNWASGAVGIAMARQAYAKLSRKCSVMPAGNAGNEEEDLDDTELEAEETGNLKFAQPIKEKHIALSAAKKQKKHLNSKKKEKF